MINARNRPCFGEAISLKDSDLTTSNAAIAVIIAFARRSRFCLALGGNPNHVLQMSGFFGPNPNSAQRLWFISLSITQQPARSIARTRT